MKNVVLVGVGPHAKRIYLNYFKKHKNVKLSLVVDLDSKKEMIKNFLNENGFKDTKIFTINDIYKDDEYLPEEVSSNFLAVCKTLEITHMIIATEPKAHFMYLNFALKNNIHVLTDKPITVVKNMTSLKSIERVRSQYYEILDLSKQSKASCKVMCQRQYHRGYEKVKEILTNVVEKYKLPITNIEISYSDGAWEMPHDMEKENHPYKYGYGELFHSGYHFIDLLSNFLKINDSLNMNKKIFKGEVFSKVFTPNDEINILNIEDYKRLFKKQSIPEYYYKNTNPEFNNYGEKDYHGLFTFYNKKGFVITNASLNLLHNGISKRSNIETKEFYKSNGRIRHESMNIEIAHLLNIQIHSYQSKEINERCGLEETVGGLEHFDIYIFSNPLVDKVSFKEIHLGDMYTEKEKKDFLGYNELAREEFITNFLNNKECKGDIKDQALAIEMLYSCSKGIYNYYKKINKPSEINVRNEYTYPVNAKNLRKYSDNKYRNYEGKIIKGDINFKDIYTFYSFIKYIDKLKCYTVCISIDDSKNVVGGLLLKRFNNKFFSYIYYKYLNWIIKNMNISFISKLLER